MAIGRDPFEGNLQNGQGQGEGNGQGPNVLRPRAGQLSFGIFETLTKVTPTSGVAPGLAVRWEALSPTKWRFALRPGVVFHDGTPLDAGAVVRVLQTAARRQDPIRGLEEGSAQAVGDRAVEIDLTVPNLRLPEQLANPSLGIMAPGTTAGRGEDAAHTPTGTGPFRFSSYTKGKALRVVANGRYWGEPPRLRGITFRFAGPGEGEMLLKAGEVDVMFQPSPEAGAATTGSLVVSRPARAVYMLLNAAGEEEWALLRDKTLRRAVALALDRKKFTRAVWAGHGQPNLTLAPPAVLGPAASAAAAPDHDFSAARRLLESAGWALGTDGVRWRDGRRLTLSLLLSNPEERDAAITAVHGDLARVGIGVEIQQPAQAVPLQLVNQARFHLFLDSRLQDDANPCAFCRFFSSHPGGVLSVSSAVGGGPQADLLFEQAFATPLQVEAGRHAADLLHLVAAEQFVVVPLSLVGTAWLVGPGVRAFVPAAVPGAQSWQGTWRG